MVLFSILISALYGFISIDLIKTNAVIEQIRPNGEGRCRVTEVRKTLIESPVFMLDVLTYAEITISGKKFRVIIDTASSTLAIPAKGVHKLFFFRSPGMWYDLKTSQTGAVLQRDDGRCSSYSTAWGSGCYF